MESDVKHDQHRHIPPNDPGPSHMSHGLRARSACWLSSQQYSLADVCSVLRSTAEKAPRDHGHPFIQYNIKLSMAGRNKFPRLSATQWPVAVARNGLSHRTHIALVKARQCSNKSMTALHLHLFIILTCNQKFLVSFEPTAFTWAECCRYGIAQPGTDNLPDALLHLIRFPTHLP